MKHAVTKPHPPFTSKDNSFTVHQVPVWQDNLVWILVCNKTGEAAAVDGPEAQPILEYCETHDLKLTTILNTHTHMDHIGINSALESTGELASFRVIGPPNTAVPVPGLTDPVKEGDTITIGQVTGHVMVTEGHIDGHVSYVFDDVLFCGDTMFGAGCGYLFDGPPEKMHDSLNRLATLDEGTRVCCAHEYTQDNLRFAWSIDSENADLAQRIKDSWAVREDGGSTVPSTIGLEKRTNPFLRYGADELVARVKKAWPEKTLEAASDIFAATRDLKDRKDYRNLKDSDLPL